MTASTLTIITAVTLRVRPTTLGAYTAIVLGLLTIPIELLAIYAGYLTLESRIEKIGMDQKVRGLLRLNKYFKNGEVSVSDIKYLAPAYRNRKDRKRKFDSS